MTSSGRSGPILAGLPIHWPESKRRGAEPTHVVDRVTELSSSVQAARCAGQSVGLVPTMGALHEGHRSLVRRAVAECDRVVVTIFVNPLQFGDPTDLERYPRTLQQDLELCQQEGAAMVFVPPVEEMYPGGADRVSTTVRAGSAARDWEGSSRPGHFDGVATVVAKLLAMTGRCRAYFGDKDFQQLAVLRQMVRDLSFPVELVGCPTIRERHGLALSSRNARLSRAERVAAGVLYQALLAGRRLVEDAEVRPDVVMDEMARMVSEEPLARLDYAALVDPETLEIPPSIGIEHPWRLLLAATVGPVRLIDNMEAYSPTSSRRLSTTTDELT